MRLLGLEPAVSHDAPAVQVADSIAGACAEVLRSAVTDRPSPWVARLDDARVLRFVEHFVWPPDEALAARCLRQRDSIDD